MRTTLDINDALLIRAKRRAAGDRRTLTSVVEEALRKLLDGAQNKAKRIPEIPVFDGGQLAPGIDPTRIEACLNELEAAEFGRKHGKS